MYCKLDFVLNFNGFEYRFIVIRCFRKDNVAKKFKRNRSFCCFSILKYACVEFLTIVFRKILITKRAKLNTKHAPKYTDLAELVGSNVGKNRSKNVCSVKTWRKDRKKRDPSVSPLLKISH